MKTKVVFEDTVSAYNKWVSGQASREFSAIKTKFNDLFGDKKGKEDQYPNNAKGDNVLPYPIPNTVSILGDLITNTTSAINNYKTALKHPLVREDEKARKEVQAIVNCLEKSLHDLKSIFDVLEAGAKEDDA
jgi:hypothetical protein